MKRNGHYWTREDKDALLTAATFSELAVIALAVLGRMPAPVSQVCGPISTGSLGSIEKNITVFDATIEHLIEQGYTVFDQVPFEDHLFRIIESGVGTRQNDALLNEFYLPIFESKQVSCLYFIHGWESSYGANWERQQAKRLNIEIVDLEPGLVAV